jgi:hypothetical protein
MIQAPGACTGRSNGDKNLSNSVKIGNLQKYSKNVAPEFRLS